MSSASCTLFDACHVLSKIMESEPALLLSFMSQHLSLQRLTTQKRLVDIVESKLGELSLSDSAMLSLLSSPTLESHPSKVGRRDNRHSGSAAKVGAAFDGCRLGGSTLSMQGLWTAPVQTYSLFPFTYLIHSIFSVVTGFILLVIIYHIVHVLTSLEFSDTSSSKRWRCILTISQKLCPPSVGEHACKSLSTVGTLTSRSLGTVCYRVQSLRYCKSEDLQANHTLSAPLTLSIIALVLGGTHSVTKVPPRQSLLPCSM